MGSKELEIRLGGIYALERIANESEKDYWPIMEILTAYVRKNSSVDVIENKNVKLLAIDIQANESKQKEVSETKKIALDIQAVLTIIGRRKYSLYKDEYTLNLRRTNLQGANLCLSDFNGVNLERANLSDSNLQWAKIRGTNLKEADLKDADLQKCDLRGSNLRGADLRATNNLEVTTNLEGADLRDSDLVDAKLCGANLIDAKLEKASLNGAFLKEADFTRANLRGGHLKNADADLKGTKFKWAHFEEAQLPWANLSGANLRMTHFEEANLIGVLEEAYLQVASLEGTDLQKANLKGAKNLTVDQLSKVKTLYKAKLDSELEIPLREKYAALFEAPIDEP